MKRKTRALLIAIGVLLSVFVPAAVAIADTDTYYVGEGAHFAAIDGPDLEVGYQLWASSGNPFPDDNTVDLDPLPSISSDGPTSLTVDSHDDEWTTFSNVDAGDDEITIDGDSRSAVGFGGDVESFEYGDVSAAGEDNGETDLVYSGPGGTTTSLTLNDVPASTGIAAVDLDSGEILDSTASNGDGVATLDVPNDGSDREIDIIQTGSQVPSIDDPSPRRGDYVSDRNVTLSASVENAGDDEFTVEFYVNNSGEWESVGSETSSGEEVSVDYTADPGENEWTAVIQEQDTDPEDAVSYTFVTPNDLTIHNASNTSKLIDDDVDVTIESLTGDYYDERSTSDGTLDLSGVPREDLRFTFDADGYANRSVITTDPSQRVYTTLQREDDDDTFRQCYELVDESGRFETSSTYLMSQVRINGTHRDVMGAQFGAANIACLTLEDGEEYRMAVENQDSVRKGVGGYSADSSRKDEVLPIIIEEAGLGIPEGETYATDIYAERINDTDKGRVVFKFDAGTADVEDLSLSVYERNNEDTPLFETTQFGEVSIYSETVALSEEQLDDTFIVEWSATIDDEEVSNKVPVGVSGINVDLGLSSTWMTIVGSLLVIFVGGMFGGIHAGIGAVVTAGFSGLLVLIGWLDIPETVVVFAITVGIGFYISGRLN
ncbi:YrzE family protein [Haloprofundus halobius]|uniref:YrzE family protein n=1 Tax=Haloprofundus halobius TaxID=2876194 RepID=UPI001CC8F3A9|nr:YrzE family protein [Haloprofundus halobius]